MNRFFASENKFLLKISNVNDVAIVVVIERKSYDESSHLRKQKKYGEFCDERKKIYCQASTLPNESGGSSRK